MQGIFLADRNAKILVRSSDVCYQNVHPATISQEPFEKVKPAICAEIKRNPEEGNISGEAADEEKQQ